MKKIIFCLYLLSFNFLYVQAQNVIEIGNGSGITLEENQIEALEAFATNTLPAFSDSNFKIIDASFYTYNDEMGEEREKSIWENFKSEAKTKSPNYLLLGRQYFEDKGGFKLWVHLEVDIEDLECYDANLKSEITEYISAAQLELVEWYEYLSFKPETNGFEIVEQVAELGYFKLDKLCCEIDPTRNFCSADRLDPKQIEDEKNLKYFVLGRLRCLFESHGCSGPVDISNDNALNSLTEASFRESSNSLFWQSSDNLEKFSSMHIYISENNTNSVSCDVVPDETQTRSWYIDSDLVEEIEVRVYNLGKFTIVIEKEKDLFEILGSISTEIASDLDQIVSNLAQNKPVGDDQTNLLNFASLCDFLDLEEPEKYDLMELIVSEGNASWYEFWRWFVEEYPIFIRQLYDAIGEDDGSGYLNKKLFFEHQAKSGNVKFANDLLSYDFPIEIRKGFFKDYCIDYQKSCFSIGGDPLVAQINGIPVNSMIYIPYEVNKFLNFYSTNFQFQFIKDTEKVDFSKKVHSQEWHGNSSGTVSEWVHFESEKPFHPVCLAKIDVDQFSTLAGVLPAIVLPRIQEYIDDENFFNGVMLAVDVVSTISVVGNVGKLRHLGKAKLFFTGVEITATLGQNLVTYTNLITDKALKQKVSIFLAVIEVAAAVGNGMSPSDLKHIQDEGNKIAKLLDEEPSADPKLAAGIRFLSGGKGELLERIKKIFGETNYADKDFYKYVLALDEVDDAIKISRLSALANHSLIQATTNLIETQKIAKFANDLADLDKGLGLVLFFNAKNGGVKAWDKVKTLKPSSKLSTDVDVLTVISRQLDDADLMAIIGADRYDDIIKKYAGQCKTCDPPVAGASESVKHLPSHDEMLETLETFANKHHGKPSFDDVLNDLKSSDPRKQKGSEFVTRILKNDTDIAAFEYQYIGGQNNTADWVTLNGRKIDGKSWSVSSSIDNIGSWNFPGQLKDYFANPPFEMWFDYLRFTKSSNLTYKAMSKVEATVHVKKQYQKLFQKPAKAQELFDHITNNSANVQAFQDLFGVNNVNSFISNIVSDLDNVALYGAFKVK